MKTSHVVAVVGVTAVIAIAGTAYLAAIAAKAVVIGGIRGAVNATAQTAAQT